MSFLQELFGANERKIDTVVVSNYLGLVALFTFSAVVVFSAPADFSPISFAGGVATLIGAGGAVKTVRDRFAPKDTEE